MSTIKISGKTSNIKKLVNLLALPKGSNLIFATRKLVVKTGGILMARQSATSLYSQLILKPEGDAPFLKVEGEGDMMLNMEKIITYVNELSNSAEIVISHDTESHETVLASFDGSEEWKTHEPSVEIDDGGALFGQTTPFSYKNLNSCVPPGDTPYKEKVGVQFNIDATTMRAVGDKAEKVLDEQYPIRFDKDKLVVFASNPNDISTDSFRKDIPVTYTVNNMDSDHIVLGRDFKNIFNNLDGVVTFTGEKTDPANQSVYISRKEDGGLYIGIQLKAKQVE